MQALTKVGGAAAGGFVGAKVAGMSFVPEKIRKFTPALIGAALSMFGGKSELVQSAAAGMAGATGVLLAQGMPSANGIGDIDDYYLDADVNGGPTLADSVSGDVEDDYEGYNPDGVSGGPDVAESVA